MKNNYLLESQDSLSLKKIITKLIEKNNFKNATINTYDMDETSLENALEDLDTYSFLTEKKVIIIYSIENINQEENKKYIEHLYHYIDNYNPDNLLIICAKKLNNTLKLTKELKKKAEYIQVSFEPIEFAKNELKGYQIDKDALTTLLNFCKEDITKLGNECDKLKLYKADTKKITKSDIEEMVIQKLGDSTELTFAFTRSLASRDKKDALKKYQELLDYQIEPLGIIGLLAGQIRIMYQVKVLEKKRYSNNEIADQLNEKAYRISKTKELTRYFSEKDLLKLMIELADIDLKIKTTDSDPNFLIQLFILNM